MSKDPDERTDPEEASFFAAERQINGYIQRFHGVSVSFREDPQGRLMLHCAGMKSITCGYHDAGGEHVPHLTIHLGPRE